MHQLPESRLPERCEYWDDLARRIGEDAAGPLAAYAAQGSWYGALSRGAPWLVAVCAIAVLALWLVLPPADPAAEFRWMEGALIPAEPAGTLIAGPAPPPVEVLMTQVAPAHTPAEGER